MTGILKPPCMEAVTDCPFALELQGKGLGQQERQVADEAGSKNTNKREERV